MKRAVLLLALLPACAGDYARRVVTVDDASGRSHVDQLHLVLEALRPIRAATLSVDGEPWGRFEVAEPRERVLIVARRDVTGQELPTAGAWVDFLGRSLAPGGHVAEVSAVELADGGRLEPRAFLPFDVADGVTTVNLEPLALAPEAADGDAGEVPQ